MTLYKQFIRPILDYGAVATAGAAASSIKHLEVAERKALRFATFSSRFTSSKELYKSAGFQPIGGRLNCLKQKVITGFGDRPGIQELKNLKDILGVRH